MVNNNDMETKQTAVEWLMMQLPVFIRVDLYEKELYQQAKKKEKEQIKDAWLAGQDDGATICTPNQHYPDEDFYNKTYGE